MSPKSLEITVEPSVLEWARKSAGYYSIEEVAGFKEGEIFKWESGAEKPTLSKLEKLANKYKRPLAAFFLPKPPKEKPLPKDFRTLPETEKTGFSPKTLLAIRRATRLQSLANELMENLGQETISQIKIKRENPENQALEIRKMLRVDIQEQFTWRHEYEAMKMWRKKIQEVGVFVFQSRFPFRDARGFSLTTEIPPIIMLNISDSPNGRIFSLFHEYAHILLNNGGICDMEEIHLRSESALTEQFCNHLAGAILVPRDNLLNHELVNEYKGIGEWPEEILREIAADYKVSREVILRRLMFFGEAQLDFYQRKHKEWTKQLEEDSKLRKEKTKKEKFLRNIPSECVRDNSVPFVSLVLEAHAQKVITYNDVADYLGIRLKHLPKIATLIKI